MNGNIGNDLELKHSNDGKPYLKFNLAVKDNYNRGKTHWIPCTTFGKTSELIAQYCSKGSKIAIEGSWNANQVEKDGEKRTYHSVSVNRVEFLSNGNSGEKSNVGGMEGKEVEGPEDDYPF